jgi:hypothetical protein
MASGSPPAQVESRLIGDALMVRMVMHMMIVR